MPGIYGLASATPLIDAPDRLGAMAERLRHHPWYVEGRHVDRDGGVALGCTALGIVAAAEQPATAEDRSLVVVMTGEVLDADEQRRTLAAAGHRCSGDSPAELLLRGYRAGGRAFFRGLHGAFAAAIWDARPRRLILVNDRFGMRPLYYAKLPGGLPFASEIKALLADPRVPRRDDLRGIAQFFTFGQLLGEDTFFEAVRLLPAAGWLSYDVGDDRLTVDRYWGLEADSGAVGRGGPEHLDRIDAAFRAPSGAAPRRRAGWASRSPAGWTPARSWRPSTTAARR